MVKKSTPSDNSKSAASRTSRKDSNSGSEPSKKKTSLVRRPSTDLAAPSSSLEQYLREISVFPLLSREEEEKIARQWIENEDMDAARKLVTSNLRFVVKVAYEFRNYDIKIIDLIQEGNIGLMKAVRKFNPDRGYRLISYAVWWIRAYMQNHIIKNWSMVKIGTTTRHRQMLFGSKETREALSEEQGEETYIIPASNAFRVTTDSPTKTQVAKRDFSLDAAMDDMGRTSFVEMVQDHGEDAETGLVRQQTREHVQHRLSTVIDTLNERERLILESRLLDDEPMTLQELGDHFGVSRERARQLEANLKKKLVKVIAEPGMDLDDFSS